MTESFAILKVNDIWFKKKNKALEVRMRAMFRAQASGLITSKAPRNPSGRAGAAEGAINSTEAKDFLLSCGLMASVHLANYTVHYPSEHLSTAPPTLPPRLSP